MKRDPCRNMNRDRCRRGVNRVLSSLAAALVLCAAAAAPAQQPPQPQQQAEPPEPKTPGEPNVQRTVVEDDGVRIEELRVRGQTQRIVVRSKAANAAPYEIVPIDGAREIPQNRANTRGAEGKRVWSVLSF